MCRRKPARKVEVCLAAEVKGVSHAVGGNLPTFRKIPGILLSTLSPWYNFLVLVPPTFKIL